MIERAQGAHICRSARSGSSVSGVDKRNETGDWTIPSCRCHRTPEPAVPAKPPAPAVRACAVVRLGGEADVANGQPAMRLLCLTRRLLDENRIRGTRIGPADGSCPVRCRACPTSSAIVCSARQAQRLPWPSFSVEQRRRSKRRAGALSIPTKGSPGGFQKASLHSLPRYSLSAGDGYRCHLESMSDVLHGIGE